MIKINVNENEVMISGHSDYEEYGKDIVCSAVSSIFITTVNAILRFNKSSIRYERKEDIKKDDNDYSKIIIIKHNKTVDLLIDNMVDMFKELSFKYPNDIKIKER